jgi:hypothetical protein
MAQRFMLAAVHANAYLARMDQEPTPAPLPEGWTGSVARGEADLAAGRVYTIDTDALCREIEAEADELERQIAARHASPA